MPAAQPAHPPARTVGELVRGQASLAPGWLASSRLPAEHLCPPGVNPSKVVRYAGKVPMGQPGYLLYPSLTPLNYRETGFSLKGEGGCGKSPPVLECMSTAAACSQSSSQLLLRSHHPASALAAPPACLCLPCRPVQGGVEH